MQCHNFAMMENIRVKILTIRKENLRDRIEYENIQTRIERLRRGLQISLVGSLL